MFCNPQNLHHPPGTDPQGTEFRVPEDRFEGEESDKESSKAQKKAAKDPVKLLDPEEGRSVPGILEPGMEFEDGVERPYGRGNVGRAVCES